MSVSTEGRQLAVLGGGNLGHALARGWVRSGLMAADQVHVTRREKGDLADLAAEGFLTGWDNLAAIESSRTIVAAVQPQQMVGLLDEIRDALDPARHRLISVASGVSIAQIAKLLRKPVPIVRAMPNTAIEIGESMTCLAAEEDAADALAEAVSLFDAVGRTLCVREEMMFAATALCACGVAFFLRSVRAASQGGIEIGFHPEEALLLAAQTAKGAAGLVLRDGSHPESEIDRVTTPRGCTIAGLNEMEHQGFSSAMIKGILLSSRQAEGLFAADQ